MENCTHGVHAVLPHRVLPCVPKVGKNTRGDVPGSKDTVELDESGDGLAHTSFSEAVTVE